MLYAVMNVDRRGQLKEQHWGEPVTGKLLLECANCGGLWEMEVEDYVIAEGIGERCPLCNLVSTNWIVDLVNKGMMDAWF